eukprot:CAMPEP_0202812796 /NCGR_PEP_ID=MMETSP1389-20130828/4373_1 /ASSEMBLY_ACC=CAM_ASM_000865 /TAXON_ID=302021 /ORGANISM="Rhodomonas sp., Strain CCMP768" /LENGTH=80 /DNA_ID=CAMNT_0049484271 /DNA_START=72 /DNA_END=311 /DNA_ORIENTATION=-
MARTSYADSPNQPLDGVVVLVPATCPAHGETSTTPHAGEAAKSLTTRGLQVGHGAGGGGGRQRVRGHPKEFPTVPAAALL